MTTFPNAAPPPGALFDNVPTVAVTEKYAATFGVSAEHARTLIEGAALEPVPAHLTPAARIAQVRGGRWVTGDVLMQYGEPIPLDLALRRVRNGRTVSSRGRMRARCWNPYAMPLQTLPVLRECNAVLGSWGAESTLDVVQILDKVQPERSLTRGKWG